ncbi:Translation initiation factor 2 subunit gamma [Candidatus Tiddalikarchaeum anstoanum]|nr:Translation initiation factor 2 subunit gamma [Candidatus Tiddalikarchaeum anstoanum]
MIIDKKEVILPEISMGVVGHLNHGKTTILERLTGKRTTTHSEEIRRGITIKLGYAQCTIYKCEKCDEPECYSTVPMCMKHNSKSVVQRKISFVDAPGHETLMATMLSGAAIMDAAILVIAANEPCPQQQTREHLIALDTVGVKNIIIVQNKIDLVTPEQLKKNYNEINAFVKGTVAETAPIIPISAQQGINIDALLQAIQTYIKTPVRDLTKDPIMIVARSFDVNRPGKAINDLVGSVLGGALKQGRLKKGDEIIILPGFHDEDKKTWTQLKTVIDNLNYGDMFIDEVKPGGSFGLSTKLDPYFCKADRLAGNVVCLANKPINVFTELFLETHIIERNKEVTPLKINEPLLINAWTSRTSGVIKNIKKDIINIILTLPIAILPGERVVISRKVNNRWVLTGWGKIVPK